MDKKPVLAVVIILGLVTLVCVVGAITLTGLDKNVPDGIWTIAATAVGATAAVLTSARYTNGAPLAAEPIAAVGELHVHEPLTARLVEVPDPIVGASLPPSALGQQAPVPPGPMDANLINGYETGPADQPSDAALTADTMGVPPAQG